MKILHILRSAPDDMVRLFIQQATQGEKGEEIPLYEGKVNYEEMLRKIFESDKVISWW